METLDISNTGIDANEQNNSKSSELVKTEQIGKTPFVLVKREDENTGFVALGQYKLTEEGITMKGAETLTGGEDWEFMIAVIGAITNQTIQTYLTEIKNGK